MPVEKIEFTSDGYRLIGELHLPQPGEQRGAVVLTGPFAGVKQQFTGFYTQRFASCDGRVRVLGRRGGREPRQAPAQPRVDLG
jgi:hypothetical protein